MKKYRIYLSAKYSSILIIFIGLMFQKQWIIFLIIALILIFFITKSKIMQIIALIEEILSLLLNNYNTGYLEYTNSL